MASYTLPVQKRASGLRSKGKIPAVAYGRGKETTHMEMDYQAFRKIFIKAGESSIIELEMDGKKTPALVHDVQFDPVSDVISHVDFYFVDMAKEVTAKVVVKTVGVAPAVKNLGGVLTVQKHEITIKCLPKDLLAEIVVDVSGLDTLHSSIHVKDLKVSGSVKVVDHPEDTVANVRPPKIEEEKPAEVVPVEGEGVAPAEGAEGAAPAEGAQPAAGAPAEKGKKEKE